MKSDESTNNIINGIRPIVLCFLVAVTINIFVTSDLLAQEIDEDEIDEDLN